VISRVFGPGAWDLHYLEAGFASSADARAALRMLRESGAATRETPSVEAAPRVVEVRAKVDEAALLEAAKALYLLFNQSLLISDWDAMDAEDRRFWRTAAYRALRAAGVEVDSSKRGEG
jgi:hypothetical protein